MIMSKIELLCKKCGKAKEMHFWRQAWCLVKLSDNSTYEPETNLEYLARISKEKVLNGQSNI